MGQARIDPMPPVADAALPWDRELADPVAEIARARAACGDTFVIDGADGPTLFLFSPAGVAAFYALAETEASKGYADWSMLRRKLPDELFEGRRTMVHDLFGRDEVRGYLGHLDRSITTSVDELGDDGTVDLFAFTRRLGHRMGLAAWAGEDPEDPARFDAFVRTLDRLDGADAFVHPEAMAAVAAADKADERAALAEVEALIAATVAARDASPHAGPDGPTDGPGDDDLFGRIVARWSDVAEPERSVGIARDVVLVHLGSMSNLFAAMGWMLAHLGLHPDVAERVRAGEDGLAERCALESIRIGQRSIMLRKVIHRATVADEHATYALRGGVQVATLLPLTNASAMAGLDRYDPDRWGRRRLRAEDQLAARELVTTFGHGSHTCPAQPFSLAAMARTATRLVDGFELAPRFAAVEPLAVQIGGVARSQDPCVVALRRRLR